ncbi:MAG: hypothetical protein NTX64_17575 [Elusimicrobia bacterium]|nr:hypothetical protein [Elusimicrobiota bacterium]
MTVPLAQGVDKLDSLSVGMSRDQVVTVLGAPDLQPPQPPGRRPDGSASQLDSYRLYGRHDALQDGLLCPITLYFCFFPNSWHVRSYWVQYLDGKLARWGKAGGWKPDELQPPGK